MQVAAKSVLVSQVWWAQISSTAAESLVTAGGVGYQRAGQGAGGHWSFTSVMAAWTAVVSAMVLRVV